MRIIAGKYRRHRLFEVPNTKTRSTKDRVKETLFNMIGPYADYKNTLDLYAGSGALGLEALSRFSEKCTFIENDKEAYRVLTQNIDALKLHNITDKVNIDAETFIKQSKTKFDLILLDPPYQENTLTTVLKHIDETGCLSSNGLIVTLSHKKTAIEIPTNFRVKKERWVGITKILLIEWSD